MLRFAPRRVSCVAASGALSVAVVDGVPYAFGQGVVTRGQGVVTSEEVGAALEPGVLERQEGMVTREHAAVVSREEVEPGVLERPPLAATPPAPAALPGAAAAPEAPATVGVVTSDVDAHRASCGAAAPPAPAPVPAASPRPAPPLPLLPQCTLDRGVRAVAAACGHGGGSVALLVHLGGAQHRGAPTPTPTSARVGAGARAEAGVLSECSGFGAAAAAEQLRAVTPSSVEVSPSAPLPELYSRSASIPAAPAAASSSAAPAASSAAASSSSAAAAAAATSAPTGAAESLSFRGLSSQRLARVRVRARARVRVRVRARARVRVRATVRVRVKGYG